MNTSCLIAKQSVLSLTNDGIVALVIRLAILIMLFFHTNTMIIKESSPIMCSCTYKFNLIGHHTVHSPTFIKLSPDGFVLMHGKSKG